MEQLGMQRLEEFADAFGLGRTTVYSLGLGRTSAKGTPVKPSIDTLVKLATALEVPLHELTYELVPQAYGAQKVEHGASSPVVQIPCHKAGSADRSSTEKGTTPPTVWVEEAFAQDRELLAFQVLGDSMDGGNTPIKHNDIVIVDRGDKGSNNSAVIANLANGQMVCKILKSNRDGHFVQLASANVQHADATPTAVPPEQVREILGRVVRIIHDTTR